MQICVYYIFLCICFFGNNVAESVPFNVAADLYMKSVVLVGDELMIRVNVIVETKDKNEKASESLLIPFIYPPLKVEVSFFYIRKIFMFAKCVICLAAMRNQTLIIHQ